MTKDTIILEDLIVCWLQLSRRSVSTDSVKFSVPKASKLAQKRCYGSKRHHSQAVSSLATPHCNTSISCGDDERLVQTFYSLLIEHKC